MVKRPARWLIDRVTATILLTSRRASPDGVVENVTVVTDPVFLSEPIVRSNDYYRQPVDPGRLALRMRRRRADSRSSCRCGAALPVRPTAIRTRVLKPLPAATRCQSARWRDDVSRTQCAAAHGKGRRGERTALACSRPAVGNEQGDGRRSRATETSISGPFATTSTCCSATAGTSSCRPSIPAATRRWAPPAGSQPAGIVLPAPVAPRGVTGLLR